MAPATRPTGRSEGCGLPPATSPSSKSGEANSWWRTTADSNAARICATSRWREAMRRCARPGGPGPGVSRPPSGPAAEFPELAIWRDVPESQRKLVRSMIAPRVNPIDTSSCGRLFDAVASLIGLRQQINFEGQAAIELETITAEGLADSYPFALDADTAADTVDFRPTIERIVAEVRVGTPAPAIAARFHNTVAEAIVEVCRRLRAEEKLNRVCLSGGTFQNMKLLARTLAGLRRLGFEVFIHAQVPPNDGGIALGQAVIATEVLRGKG